MLSLNAAELKRTFGANLSIDRVRTESGIFSDLEKVWKMEKKSGEMVNDGLDFFFQIYNTHKGGGGGERCIKTSQQIKPEVPSDDPSVCSPSGLS